MKARKLIEGLSRLPRRTVDAHLDAHLRGVIERTTAAAQYASTAEAKGRASRLPRIALFIAIPAVAAVVTSVTVVIKTAPRTAQVAAPLAMLVEETRRIVKLPATVSSSESPSHVEAMVMQTNPLDAARANLVVEFVGNLKEPPVGKMVLGFADYITGDKEVRIERCFTNLYSLRFSNIPAVECSIHTWFDEYMTVSTNISLSGCAGETVVVPLPVRSALVLDGIVADAASHAPVPGARVSTIFFGATNTVLSDARGRFSMPGARFETVTLRVCHEDYLPQRFSVHLASFERDGALLELKRHARVFGKVTDAQGNTVTGCTVSSMSYVHGDYNSDQEQYACETTSMDGTYELDRVMPSSRVDLHASGDAVSGWRTVSLNAGEEREVNLIVSNRPLRLSAVRPARRGFIHIIVRESDGTPLTNALLVLTVGNSVRFLRDRSLRECGEAVLEERPGTYRLMSLMPTLRPVSNVVIRSGATTDVLMVAQPFIPRINGRVVRANGKPAVGVHLSMECPEQPDEVKVSYFTDTLGQFHIPVPDSSAQYTPTMNEPLVLSEAARPVAIGDEPTLVLKPYTLVSLVGLVTNTAVLVTGIKCAVDPEPGGSARTWGGRQTSDPNALRFYIMQSGPHVLRFEAQGYEPIIIKRTINPDEDIDLGTLYFVPLSTTNAP